MSRDYAPMTFDDLEPVEIPVRINKNNYILREASGEAARKWRNFSLSRAQYDSEGNYAGPGEIADSEPLLISLCLVYAAPRLNDKVGIDEVRSWPPRVAKALFEKAKEISGLGAEEDTVEGLRERISILQRKLDTLLAKANGHSPNPVLTGGGSG